mgnify:CR=1 FL=1
MLKITPASKHHPVHSRRRTLNLPLGAQGFLAAFEGIEGGFAIGSSIVVALGLAGLERHLLLVTAVIGIIVSGFNSAAVKYSSEHYLDELDGREKRSPFRNYFLPSFIEFVCYVLLSFVSVLPLILLEETMLAVSLSVAVTVSLLFLAGLWRGYMLHMNGLRDGIETALLGLGIIVVGLVSGLVSGSL